MKTRIIERVFPDGRTVYVIQQPHFLCRWLWIDAWLNSTCGAACQDSWSTLEEAQDNLWRFNGSKPKETVMPNEPISSEVSNLPPYQPPRIIPPRNFNNPPDPPDPPSPRIIREGVKVVKLDEI